MPETKAMKDVREKKTTRGGNPKQLTNAQRSVINNRKKKAASKDEKKTEKKTEKKMITQKPKR